MAICPGIIAAAMGADSFFFGALDLAARLGVSVTVTSEEGSS